MKKNIGTEIEIIDIIYGIFHNYYQCDNHRDYKIILESSQQIKYEILLKGVIKHSAESKIKSSSFSMDNKYIEKIVTPPVEAWHWGVKSFEILEWSVEKDTEELKEISNEFNKYNFSKIEFDISTMKILFIFNDFEIKKI